MNRVLSIEQLRAGTCIPMVDRLPMSSVHVEEQIHVLPIWELRNSALQRDFEFADYEAAIGFVNRVASVAGGQQHYPEMVVAPRRVRVIYTTPLVGGISINDFICAAKVDELYAA